MLQNIIINGTLRRFTFELKGASLFPVARLEISTGEKFFEVEATGQDATRMNGVIGEAPQDQPIMVTGQITARKGRDDGRVWLSLTATAVVPAVAGPSGAFGRIIGKVLAPDQKPKKDGGFFVTPRVGILAADRDGLITDAAVELNVARADEARTLADWDANLGNMVELEVNLTAWISDKGRSYTRYQINKATYSVWPAFITAFDAVGDEDGLDLPFLTAAVAQPPVAQAAPMGLV